MDPQTPAKQPQPGVAPVVPNGKGAIYQTGKGGPVVNDQSVAAMTPVKPSATTPQPLNVPQVGVFPPDPNKMASFNNKYLRIAKEWRKKTAEKSGTPEKSAADPIARAVKSAIWPFGKGQARTIPWDQSDLNKELWEAGKIYVDEDDTPYYSHGAPLTKKLRLVDGVYRDFLGKGQFQPKSPRAKEFKTLELLARIKNIRGETAGPEYHSEDIIPWDEWNNMGDEGDDWENVWFVKHFKAKGFTDVQDIGDGNYRMKDPHGNTVEWDHETNSMFPATWDPISELEEKSAADFGSMTNPFKNSDPFKPSSKDLTDEQHWGEVNTWRNNQPNLDSGFQRTPGPDNPDDMYNSYTKNFTPGTGGGMFGGQGLQKPLERNDYFAQQRWDFNRAPNGIRPADSKPQDDPRYWNSRNKETYQQNPAVKWFDRLYNPASLGGGQQGTKGVKGPVDPAGPTGEGQPNPAATPTQPAATPTQPAATSAPSGSSSRQADPNADPLDATGGGSTWETDELDDLGAIQRDLDRRVDPSVTNTSRLTPGDMGQTDWQDSQRQAPQPGPPTEERGMPDESGMPGTSQARREQDANRDARRDRVDAKPQPQPQAPTAPTAPAGPNAGKVWYVPSKHQGKDVSGGYIPGDPDRAGQGSGTWMTPWQAQKADANWKRQTAKIDWQKRRRYELAQQSPWSTRNMRSRMRRKYGTEKQALVKQASGVSPQIPEIGAGGSPPAKSLDVDAISQDAMANNTPLSSLAQQFAWTSEGELRRRRKAKQHKNRPLPPTGFPESLRAPIQKEYDAQGNRTGWNWPLKKQGKQANLSINIPAAVSATSLLGAGVGMGRAPGGAVLEGGIRGGISGASTGLGGYAGNSLVKALINSGAIEHPALKLLAQLGGIGAGALGGNLLSEYGLKKLLGPEMDRRYDMSAAEAEELIGKA